MMNSSNMNSQPSFSDSRQFSISKQGKRYFFASVVVIAILWLLVFPTLARWTGAPERLERYENAGVDVSATFYTDLPLLSESATTD